TSAPRLSGLGPLGGGGGPPGSPLHSSSGFPPPGEEAGEAVDRRRSGGYWLGCSRIDGETFGQRAALVRNRRRGGVPQRAGGHAVSNVSDMAVRNAPSPPARFPSVGLRGSSCDWRIVFSEGCDDAAVVQG